MTRTSTTATTTRNSSNSKWQQRLGPRSDVFMKKMAKSGPFSVDTSRIRNGTRRYRPDRVEPVQEGWRRQAVHIVPKLDWKTLESFLIGEAAPFDPITAVRPVLYRWQRNLHALQQSCRRPALAAARASYDPLCGNSITTNSSKPGHRIRLHHGQLPRRNTTSPPRK